MPKYFCNIELYGQWPHNLIQFWQERFYTKLNNLTSAIARQMVPLAPVCKALGWVGKVGQWSTDLQSCALPTLCHSPRCVLRHDRTEPKHERLKAKLGSFNCAWFNNVKLKFQNLWCLVMCWRWRDVDFKAVNRYLFLFKCNQS